MSQSFKDWVDVLSKIVAAIGILIAAFNYRKQTKTKRAEWLKELFEKFYEKTEYKDVRRWFETGEIEKNITLEETVSDDDEKFTDYLNFFEFIATLEAEGQLKRKDVINLFDYYLRKLKNSPASMQWINNKKYGFEKLRNLLSKLR